MPDVIDRHTSRTRHRASVLARSPNVSTRPSEKYRVLQSRCCSRRPRFGWVCTRLQHTEYMIRMERKFLSFSSQRCRPLQGMHSKFVQKPKPLQKGAPHQYVCCRLCPPCLDTNIFYCLLDNIQRDMPTQTCATRRGLPDEMPRSSTTKARNPSSLYRQIPPEPGPEKNRGPLLPFFDLLRGNS